MILKYRNTYRDYWVPFLLQNPDAEKNATRDFYSQMALWWMLLGFAIYVSIVAEMIIASFMFAGALLHSLW
ncbi:MAG: hypothetical protein AAF226_10220, partial [Verrucomicrobiota bacterium]